MTSPFLAAPWLWTCRAPAIVQGDGACLALTIANLVRVTAVGLGLASVLLWVVFLGWLLSHAVLLII
jgi:hypothetical protein